MAELYRAGFAAPEGFVLTTSAFDVSLTSSEMSVSTGAVGQRLEVGLVVSDDVFDVLRRSYKELFGPARVIVRSSGVAEDAADASFAGLFRSVLDVDEAGLRTAVTAVFNCVFSPEVADYARQHGLGAAGLRMAVVVQRQIEPWISGVCFTANPVTGEQQYIVEFVHGHSSDLVSGKQSPGRTLFDSALKLIEKSDSLHLVDVPVSVLHHVTETAGKIGNVSLR